METTSDRAAAGTSIPPVVWLLVVLAALMTSVQLATTASTALLLDTETLASNAFVSGTVTLSDDDIGAALFAVTDLKRGDSGSGCVEVSYDGNLAADVRLYHQAGSGALATYLELQIEQGSGASCAAFTGSAIYDGTLAGFASSHADFANGLGSFAPTGSGQTALYRFSYEVPLDAPAGAANATADATFQWEARAT